MVATWGTWVFVFTLLVLLLFGGIFYCVCKEGQKSGTVGLSAYNNSRRTGMPNFRRTGNISTGWSRSKHVYHDTTQSYSFHDNNPSIIVPVLHGVTIEENGDCCNRSCHNRNINNDNCNRDEDCCFGGDDYLSNDDVGGGDGGGVGCDSGGCDTGGGDSGGGDTGGGDSGGGDTGGGDSGGGDTGGGDSGGGVD